MLPQVTSMDLGSPNEPGEYGCNGALVRVEDTHLEIWRDAPGTSFSTILLTRVGDSRLRLALGEPIVAE